MLHLAGLSGQLRVASTLDSVDGDAATGAVTVAGGVGVGRNLTVGGRLVVADTTQSKSTSTGAIVTAGGLGVGGNVNIEGDVNLCVHACVRTCMRPCVSV